SDDGELLAIFFDADPNAMEEDPPPAVEVWRTSTRQRLIRRKPPPEDADPSRVVGVLPPYDLVISSPAGSPTAAPQPARADVGTGPPAPGAKETHTLMRLSLSDGSRVRRSAPSWPSDSVPESRRRGRDPPSRPSMASIPTRGTITCMDLIFLILSMKN